MMSGFEIDIDGTLLLVIMWFLLGFAVYSLLFGGFSALISRQEEIGAVTTPLLTEAVPLLRPHVDVRDRAAIAAAPADPDRRRQQDEPHGGHR